jgi:hypothetical protein
MENPLLRAMTPRESYNPRTFRHNRRAANRWLAP